MRVGSIFVGLIIVFLSISGYKGHKYKITKREIMSGGVSLVHPKDMVPGKLKRIAGGAPTRPHEYPYQVALKIKYLDGTNNLCGGTILSKRWILTAAHCLTHAVSVDVYLGVHNIEIPESDSKKYSTKPEDWLIHEKYAQGTKAYDIALIRLPEKIKIGRKIIFIQIDQDDKTHTGYWGKCLGWGQTVLGTSSKVLRCADLQVISNDACQQFDKYQTIITDEHICTSGEGLAGSCSGDSGGPLVVSGIQVGIVSLVMEDCEKNAPTVFTRVSKFREWILDKTGLPRKQRSASQILGPLKALYMGMVLCVVTLNYFLYCL